MKKNQHNINDSHNIFERIINSIDDAIFSNDLNGNVLSWNKAAEKIFGYTFAEIKAKTIFAIFPSHLVDEETRFIKYVNENRIIENYETKRIRKDGVLIDISITVWPLKDENGNLIGLSKIIQDITEQREVEKKFAETEEKYKNIFENSPLPIWILEIPSLKFLDINQTSINHYGFSREEFLNMTVYDIIPEGERDRVLNVERSKFGYQLPSKYWIHIKKSGKLVYVEVTSLEILYEGKRARMVISLDVTARIESEDRIRKLDQDFINTQLRYRSIIDHSLLAIFLATPDGSILEANQAATNMFGYTNEEFKSIHRNDVIDMTRPDAMNLLMERENKGSIVAEFIGIRKNGEKFPCEITSVIFKDYAGKQLSSKMITDISERKISEEKDRKIRDLLKQSEVLANIGSIQMDLKNKESQWSDGFYTLLGYEPQSVLPSEELFYSHFSKEERDRHKKWLTECFSMKCNQSDIEVRLLRKDNQSRLFSTSTHFFYNEFGLLERLISVIQDVTDARESRLALEQSQKSVYKERALLKSIIDSPKDIYIVSLDKNYWYTAFTEGYTNHVKNLFGVAPKVGKNIFEIVDDDFGLMIKKQCDRALKGEYFLYEHTFESLSGEKKYYENHYNPIRGADGDILGLTIFIHDVTQVKKIEVSNKLNAQRYSALFSAASDAIFIVDVTTKKIVDVNTYGQELLGYKKEELVGKNISFIHPKEELENIQEIFKKVTYQTTEEYKLGEETLVLHKSGRKIPISISTGSVFTIDDRTYSAAYFKDLTKVKEAETRIDNIVEMLSRAEEIAHIGSVEIDLVSGNRIWSDEFFRIIGFAPDTIQPRKEVFVDLIVEEDKDAYLTWYERSLVTYGLVEPIEIHILTKQGDPKTILVSGITYPNEEGDLVKHIGVVMDITLRRELETDLELSHKRLKKLSEKIPIALMQIEIVNEDKFEMPFVSRGIKNIYKGLEAENFQKNPSLIVDWVLEEDKAMVLAEYQSCLNNQKDLNLECRIKNMLDELSWIKVFYHPEKLKNGQITWYGFIEDITLQKELLLNLEKQNQQLKDIAWTQSHVVRAPLSRLMGLVNLLKRGKISSEQQIQFLGHIQTSANELDDIIKDITRLSSNSK